MPRTFSDDLERFLKDPESLAYFLAAQIESRKELLRCGIIESLTEGSSSSKTKEWEDGRINTEDNLW